MEGRGREREREKEREREEREEPKLNMCTTKDSISSAPYIY